MLKRININAITKPRIKDSKPTQIRSVNWNALEGVFDFGAIEGAALFNEIIEVFFLIISEPDKLEFAIGLGV